ncbi:MAG: signal peptide peptidase SppA [Thermacetogeniaceae bacterium]
MNSKHTGMIIFIAAIAVTLIAVVVASYRTPQQAGSVGAGRSSSNEVAVIYLTGEIGFGGSSSLTGGSSADQTMQDLERATDDPGLKAVVLRIDSPGGSPAASQELNDQVQRLKESGKKVVVSCGDLAASGGYYVAVAADKIVADPATLTGSIGVISTVPNLQDLYGKIGYKEQVFKSGPHKDMLSPSRPITPEEAQIMQGIIDDTYAQFVQVVAKGRGLPVDQVRKLADGRVYTGDQAKQLGLVDELGGLHEAVALAGKMAGIASPQAVEYHRPGLTDLLRGLGGLSSLGNVQDFVAAARLLQGNDLQQLPPAYTTLKF